MPPAKSKKARSQKHGATALATVDPARPARNILQTEIPISVVDMVCHFSVLRGSGTEVPRADSRMSPSSSTACVMSNEQGFPILPSRNNIQVPMDFCAV